MRRCGWTSSSSSGPWPGAAGKRSGCMPATCWRAATTTGWPPSASGSPGSRRRARAARPPAGTGPPLARRHPLRRAADRSGSAPRGYHRLLIGLCQASGDRARAVRAYHVCATTLERELGIAPSPETRPPTSPSCRPSSPNRNDGPGTSPLVGRDAERARLAAVWQAAASGHARLVLVTGEAGIGKTRLVDELRAQTGAVTVEARAYPGTARSHTGSPQRGSAPGRWQRACPGWIGPI